MQVRSTAMLAMFFMLMLTDQQAAWHCHYHRGASHETWLWYSQAQGSIIKLLIWKLLFILHCIFSRNYINIFNEQVHVSEIVCIILHALNLLSTPCKWVMVGVGRDQTSLWSCVTWGQAISTWAMQVTNYMDEIYFGWWPWVQCILWVM